MWQPGWEGSLGENGYVFRYHWEPLAVRLKISQHWWLISYPSRQNKKFEKIRTFGSELIMWYNDKLVLITAVSFSPLKWLSDQRREMKLSRIWWAELFQHITCIWKVYTVSRYCTTDFPFDLLIRAGSYSPGRTLRTWNMTAAIKNPVGVSEDIQLLLEKCILRRSCCCFWYYKTQGQNGPYFLKHHHCGKVCQWMSFKTWLWPENNILAFTRWITEKSVLVDQSCPIVCDPVDCRLPGSSDNGILQARILEWVARHASQGSSWPRAWAYIFASPALADGFFTTEPPEKPHIIFIWS